MKTFAHHSLHAGTVHVIQNGDSVRVEIKGLLPVERIVVEVDRAELVIGKRRPAEQPKDGAR